MCRMLMWCLEDKRSGLAKTKIGWPAIAGHPIFMLLAKVASVVGQELRNLAIIHEINNCISCRIGKLGIHFICRPTKMRRQDDIVQAA